MAGLSDVFTAADAAEFRLDIRATMLLFIPEDEAQRPIFRFPRTTVYAIADRANRPFDYTSVPVSDDDPDPVLCGPDDDQVLCVWDPNASAALGVTPVGTFDASKKQLIFLDVDYDKVADFDRVDIGENSYLRGKTEPPFSLGPVTIWLVTVASRDES